MNSNMVWGGGEKWHYETACYFHDKGYDVTVITNRGSELFRKLNVVDGIRVKSIRITNFSFLNPLKFFQLVGLFRRLNISAVFLGLSTDVKLGGIAAKRAKLKHIIYRRGSAVPVKNSILNRYLFQFVLSGIITNSQEIKDKIFQKNPGIIDEKKVHIVYNGIRPRSWLTQKDVVSNVSKSEKLILGNAGRLVEQKGQIYLIQIARQLKDQGVDFKMFIAGSGKLEKSLKQDCLSNNLENDIVFLDFVEDMQEFLNGLDIYLSTSLHEGSSHVIIEAMAAGKPVIAFDISSMPELIDDKKTGYLIPFADTKLFSEKIVYLRDNQSEIDIFGANAIKMVETKFSFEKNMIQIIQLIQDNCEDF